MSIIQSGFRGRQQVAALAIAVGLLLAACSGAGNDATTAVASPTATTAATSQPSSAIGDGTASGGQVTLTIRDGTAVRYIVGEQLANRSLASDAIGVTDDVSGTIVFDVNGVVQSENSVITVDLTTLRSDESRRDNYLRDNTFQTSRYPLAEFSVREVKGLAWPLPTEGEAIFQLVGDMTLHGVTAPLSWDVGASFSPDGVSGLAATSFTFDTFEMTAPRLFFIISVEDDIRVEMAFEMTVEREG